MALIIRRDLLVELWKRPFHQLMSMAEANEIIHAIEQPDTYDPVAYGIGIQGGASMDISDANAKLWADVLHGHRPLDIHLDRAILDGIAFALGEGHELNRKFTTA